MSSSKIRVPRRGASTPRLARERCRAGRPRPPSNPCDANFGWSGASLDALARSGVMGIFVADSAGNVREVNDAFLRMVGYTRDEFIEGTVTWSRLTSPDERDDADAIAVDLATQGYVKPWEKEYVRKDGTRVPVLIGLAALDERWNVAVVSDMTEQKDAQVSLSRTEELLRQAHKMEAVGRLAGGVAHDFNNLLSVVLSYSELLIEDLPATDPMRQDLLEIQRAATRASELTSQLLLFSRHKVASTKVLDLGEVLGSMDKMLRRILGEDIDFVTVVAPGLGHVKADPTHVEQVVMNLAVNARDAMPRGGKLTLEVSNVMLDEAFVAGLASPVKPGPHVMLTVTDNGAGMDKPTLRRVFEPFFTTKEYGKGTGLGLATVFGIAQQCGGGISVVSELGHGTTFKLFLPRVDAVVPSLMPEARVGALSGSETVLLVEDEEQVRGVAAAILRDRGYRILEAQNAGEALLLCERHPGTIALLLTDVVMPSMSGPELAKRLGTIRPQMRVLCMSGYTDDSIARHGVLEDELAFLQKPLTPASLSRKVRQVLDEDHALAALPS